MKDETSEKITNTKISTKNLYVTIKRFLDIICALIGIVVSLPFIVVFSILIRVETPGNPLFIQERVGLDGRKFLIYKLRSMYTDAEKNGAQWAEKNDVRITNIGKIIRKTRIDELPQLFNVLKGDMSLIGPRPERYMFTEQFEKEIPGFKKRLAIKPGLTGLAQVNGGYDLTPQEKLELDIEYIEKQGYAIDLKILLKTVRICITGSGAR